MATKQTQEEKHLTTARSFQSLLLTQLSIVLATELFYYRTSKERCIWSQEQPTDIQNILRWLSDSNISKTTISDSHWTKFQVSFPFPGLILYRHCYFDVFLILQLSSESPFCTPLGGVICVDATYLFGWFSEEAQLLNSHTHYILGYII